MFNRLTEPTRKVLALASDEARRFNHHYVGTEHILLGLLLEGSSDAADALARLGLDIDRVRGEIEKLVQRGPSTILPNELPLTPRAKRVIELTSQEAGIVSLRVEPEHLLIGLISEPDGVAGQVMRNLGLDLDRVRQESLKIRFSQMRIVERAVRPVKAGSRHKRKMREELLSHLDAIYQEERSNGLDSLAALDDAARRLGDPGELARELQASVPASVRFDYQVEWLLGWRAPESVMHMMLRTSMVSFFIVLVITGVPVAGGIIYSGWDRSQIVALRVMAALVLLTPLSQFALGICYYKIRDFLWGVFGSRKSVPHALLWSAMPALAVPAAGIGFIAMAEGNLAAVPDSLPVMSLAGFFGGIICLALAHLRGPGEIRDTIWATLDLQAAS